MHYKSVKGWCCPEAEKNAYKKSRNQDAKFQTVKYNKIETDRTCTEMVLLVIEMLL